MPALLRQSARASHGGCPRVAAVLVLVLPIILSLPACTCRRQRFPSRGDAAAVVVIAPHRDAAPPPKVGEQEPNDRPDQAQLLSLGAETPVVALAGSLSPASNDVDMFKVAVPVGKEALPAPAIDAGREAEDPRAHARRLALEATAEAGGGVSLQLLDEGSKVMATVAVEPGESTGLPNMAVAPGHVYFIRLKALGKGGKTVEPPPTVANYQLRVQIGDFEVADEREPNDSRESATPVAIVGSAELSGFHGWQRDVDFYRIPSPEVAASLDVELDAVDGVGATLQVQDGNGNRLASGRGRKGERLALRNVLLKPLMPDAGPASRCAFVVVRADAGSNRSQRYVMRLSLAAPRLDAEVEPNDSAESATLLKDGASSGYLPVGDTDYFRYESDGPCEVAFEATFPGRVRGKLEVLRPGVAEPIAASAAKKARQTVFLAGVPSLGQPLLLRISQPKGDGNANEPYRLRVSSGPASTPVPGATNVSPTPSPPPSPPPSPQP
jgi:hypothetical protein